MRHNGCSSHAAPVRDLWSHLLRAAPVGPLLLGALPAAGVLRPPSGGGRRPAEWGGVIGPVEFIRDVLRDPETGAPFVLYPAQERFLREALTPGSDGRLSYPELVF